MWSLLSLKLKMVVLGMIVLVLGSIYGAHKLIVYKAVNRAVAETRATLQADYTKKLLEASELAREREQAMVSSADKIRKEKDAQITALNGRLGTALDGLRQRPPRPPSSSQGSPDACSCTGATGASLSREDATVLIREAARADRLRAALDQCYRQYDEVRKGLK